MKIKLLFLFFLLPFFMAAQNEEASSMHTIGLVFGFDQSSISTKTGIMVNGLDAGSGPSKGTHLGFSYDYKLNARLRFHTGFRLASLGYETTTSTFETLSIEIFNGTSFETIEFEDFVFRRVDFQIQYLEIPFNIKATISESEYAALFLQGGGIGYYYTDNTVESSLDYRFLNFAMNFGIGSTVFVEDRFSISITAITRHHLASIKRNNDIIFHNLGIEMGMHYDLK